MQSLNLIFNESFLREKLLSFDSQSRIALKDAKFVNSAVAVLIDPYKNTPFDLILIRRTDRESDKHSGEMAFPGGVFNSKLDSSLQDTVLREVEEELSIPSQKIKILGCLNDHITPKRFIITPFVAYIGEHLKTIKNDNEIQEIIQIPISFFVNSRNYKERMYLLNNNKISVGKYVYKLNNNKKYPIFGATSHIIVSFVEIIYNIKLTKEGTRRLTCADFK